MVSGKYISIPNPVGKVRRVPLYVGINKTVLNKKKS